MFISVIDSNMSDQYLSKVAVVGVRASLIDCDMAFTDLLGRLAGTVDDGLPKHS